MRIRTLFFLAFSFPIASSFADLAIGQNHELKFVDVDNNTLSTADGHVTVLVLATKADLSKAQIVGDRVPDYCLGNPTYRMITVVKSGKHSAPVRAVLAAIARRRLDAEGKRLQSRYDANKITRDARHDIFAVVDFDGNAVAQLDSQSSMFHVFVFGRSGELLQQWNDVPTAADLAAVVK